MKQVLYHGTTKEAYESILKEGFGEGKTVWNCSDNDVTYFFTEEKVKKSERLDDEDEEEIQNRCIERALESAQLTAAFSGSQFQELYVLKIEIDDEEIEIYDDESCPNMKDIASYVENENLKNITFETYVCKTGYNPCMRVFYLQNWYNHDYADLSCLSDMEEEALEAIQGIEMYSLWERLNEALYNYEAS